MTYSMDKFKMCIVIIGYMYISLEKEMATQESQGWVSLVGCRLWGRTESDTTEVT